MKSGSAKTGSAATLSLAFLAGATVAWAFLWRSFSENDAAENPSEKPFAARSAFRQPAAERAPAVDGNFSRSAVSEADAQPELKNDFTRLLTDLLHGADDERAERLGLVLGRLRRGGAASIPLIVEYLSSGRDLPQAALYGEEIGKSSSFPTFRPLLMDVLAEIVRANPALAAQTANACLPLAKTLAEAQSASRFGTSTEPETVRAAAVAAVQRLLTQKPEDADFVVATEMMGRLRAEELIPVIAAKIAQQPYEWHTSPFLAALWEFPDETRTAATRELLRRDDVRLNMRINASSYQHLDARDPEFRAVMIADFARLADEQQRGYFVRGLDYHVTTAARGELAQTPARLSLLDEIASLCTTPALQAQLAETRANLTHLLNPQ